MNMHCLKETDSYFKLYRVQNYTVLNEVWPYNVTKLHQNIFTSMQLCYWEKKLNSVQWPY